MLGERSSVIRRNGIFLMATCNALFSVQAVMTDNWSLLALSIGAFVLQIRAWDNWRKYDVGNSK
jgi:hypothetical protein